MRISLVAKRRCNERGSAVAVVLAMLGIMLVCVSVNLVAVRSLDRELKLLEKRQVRRLRHDAPGHAASTTNAAVLAAQGKQPHE
jgi:hypothetical protein